MTRKNALKAVPKKAAKPAVEGDAALPPPVDAALAEEAKKRKADKAGAKDAEKDKQIQQLAAANQNVVRAIQRANGRLARATAEVSAAQAELNALIGL